VGDLRARARRSARLKGALGAGLAVAVLGCGTASAVANPSRPMAPPPDCGRSVQLQRISYSSGTYTFKLVGVGLDQWLGRTGLGTLHYQAGQLGADVQISGQVNASGQSGADTGQRSISIGRNLPVAIEAEVYTGNYEHCVENFVVPAR
jgi:hypothetical protein